MDWSHGAHVVNPCPKCSSKTTRFVSQVSWGIPWEPFSDAKGGIHHHNPNKYFREYVCPNGHHSELTYFKPCQCGWENPN